MSLLRALHGFLPTVRLRPIKGLTRDLRDPWETARIEHKRRRARECRKVAPRTVPIVKVGKPKTLLAVGFRPSALERMLTEPAFSRRQAS